MRRRNQPSLGRRLHKWEHHRHPLAATWMKVLKGRDAKRPWRIMTLSDIVTGIFLHSGHSGWDLDTPKGRYSQSPSQVRTSFKKEFGSVYEGPFVSAMYLYSICYCYCRFASPFPCLAINHFGPKPVQPLLLAFVPHQPAFRAHTRCGFRVGREELRCHFGSVRCRCDFARKSYAKCCELWGVDKQIEHFGLLAVFEVCLPKKDPWTALIWSASLPWSVRGSGSHRQSLPSSDALPCCPTMLSLHVFFPYSSRYHILGDLRNGKTEWSAPGTDCRPQDTTGSGCGSVGSTTPSPTNSRPETRFGAGMMPQSDLLRASLFQSLSYDQLHVSATNCYDVARSKLVAVCCCAVTSVLLGHVGMNACLCSSQKPKNFAASQDITGLWAASWSEVTVNFIAEPQSVDLRHDVFWEVKPCQAIRSNRSTLFTFGCSQLEVSVPDDRCYLFRWRQAADARHWWILMNWFVLVFYIGQIDANCI